MQLTQTNTVFSRIALVSCFLCRKSSFGKIPEKYPGVPIFPEDTGSQKMRRRRATVAPHHMAARPRGGRAVVGCGRLGHPLATPFRLLKALDLKTSGGSTFFSETLQSSDATKNPNSGVCSSYFGTQPGWGIGGDHRRHHHHHFPINHP